VINSSISRDLASILGLVRSSFSAFAYSRDYCGAAYLLVPHSAENGSVCV
jgi:hypothetical protein